MSNSRSLGNAELGRSDLLDIQLRTYKSLFDTFNSFEERRVSRLYSIFKSVFPIVSSSGVYKFDFIDYEIKPPRYTRAECMNLGISYTVSLVIRLCIINQEKKSIQNKEIYIGEIPYITPTGSFIYNGIERVIVTQMHRISGISFFAHDLSRRNGEFVNFYRIIPENGVWIEVGTGVKKILYIRLSQKKKILFTYFLKAIGFVDSAEILQAFGLVEEISVSKSSLQDSVGRKIAVDVVSTSYKTVDGERAKITRVIVERNVIIDDAVKDEILASKVGRIFVYVNDDAKLEKYEPILNTLDADTTTSDVDAAEKVYSLFREDANKKSSQVIKDFVKSMIFDSSRYKLSEFGIHRLTTLVDVRKKSGVQKDVLIKDDLIALTKYLIDIINGDRNDDDVDNLSNKYLKSVGDQLYDQIRSFTTKMRMAIQEKLNITSGTELNMTDFFNAANFNTVINNFFANNFSSQFMDEINPLASLVHKRKITSIGVGGIEKDTSSSNLRDIHYSHYGRICPIETPESITIGLISSLASNAKTNYLGQILTPYRRVKGGVVDNSDVVYLNASEEEGMNIAQYMTPHDKNGLIIDKIVKVRRNDDFKFVKREDVDYIDISSNQPFSVSTSLIPFLDRDEAARALMGANMQRQAVPLLSPESPIVSTGVESEIVSVFDGIIVAEYDGVVEYVDSMKIRVKYNLSPEELFVSYDNGVKEYDVIRNKKSNQKTYISYKPIVDKGQIIKKGDVLTEGFATEGGTLSLGRNLKVAFMMWKGYNYEDAIVISEKLVKEDILTSIHLTDFETCVKDTKHSKEDFTRNVHDISERNLNSLDSNGLVKVGTVVNDGDVLVGKVVPKVGESGASEDKLLRALFGDRVCDVKDDSLTVPYFTNGTVIQTQLLKRKVSDRATRRQNEIDIRRLCDGYAVILDEFIKVAIEKFKSILVGKIANNIVCCQSGEVLVISGVKITEDIVEDVILKVDVIDSVDCANSELRHFSILEYLNYNHLVDGDEDLNRLVRTLVVNTLQRQNDIINEFAKKKNYIKCGDVLPDRVNKRAKVLIASKKKIQVGDKMSGRHGNKGVVAKILKEEDMPFLADGTPVDVVLTPLGVPSRMNIGQLYETLLGWAGERLGCKYSVPVFENFDLQKVNDELKKAGLPDYGEVDLYDGLTGEKFEQKCTVGVMYMLKLNHMVDDKIHSRSIGDYSLITQQPLGGRSQFGGQRFGEMEVWSLEAFGAASVLQEMLTIKSDDVVGRHKAYEAIIRGVNIPEPNVPEAFSVLMQELRGMCLHVSGEREGSAFSSLTLGLMSPAEVLEMSHGEVKSHETINYRTYKPELDGLFCEHIFGPVDSWKCHCGKYNGIRYKGIICDVCGVEITNKRVRRERFGHIELAVPVVHTWFFKQSPSIVGSLLGIPYNMLEKVVYYESYIVMQPGVAAKSGVKKIDIIDEAQRIQICKSLPEGNSNLSDDDEDKFIIKSGGEAIEILLKDIDLDKLSCEIREKLKIASSSLKQSLLFRLGIVDSFIKSRETCCNKPEWMTIKVLPVIPPDLRPLVITENNRVNTVDLTELYKSVVVRNNRLKQLIEVDAPDIILRNEKRMLQEAVDVLLDNSSSVNQITNKNRPLKSFSDVLKGKQGMFRQNLLGKRVDYSGRSVIVVGPELKLHECGVPKEMALELFSPFIIGKLMKRGCTNTVRGAKEIIKNREPVVFDVLEKLLKGFPVLLNRAPTLHKMSIQAFQPKLIEERAIQIHPLVCSEFNADFDGDQMAIHVPLGERAITEASLLMLSANNLLRASDGTPSFVPNRDMVLGIYYMTKMTDDVGREMMFYSPEDVVMAVNSRIVSMHTKIRVKINNCGHEEFVETNAGRVFFNAILPGDFGFINEVITNKLMKTVVARLCKDYPNSVVVKCLDDIKQLGFDWAHKSGISFNINDIRIPAEKYDIIRDTQEKIDEITDNYMAGLITDKERHNRVLDLWDHASTTIADKLMEDLKNDKDGFNSVYMMLHSGARGSKEQARQLAGMRGLIAKSKTQKQSDDSSNIIEIPITSNFKEGLTVHEYFISSYGGRKGMTDTALKTANAGYLTRRLVDVVQDVVITENDCHTKNGIVVSKFDKCEDPLYGDFAKVIVGKIVVTDIVDPHSGKVVVRRDTEIGETEAQLIEDLGFESIIVKSILTCECEHGVCARCYGRNLATNRLVQEGEPVGIIAAQSIGEPGTQLTLNTFHVGGAASGMSLENSKRAVLDGVVRITNGKIVEKVSGDNVVRLVIGYYCELQILQPVSNIVLNKYQVPYGATLYVNDGDEVVKDALLFEWDPYNSAIISTVSGKVTYAGIEDGVTCKTIHNTFTGKTDKIIIGSKDGAATSVTIKCVDGKNHSFNIPTKSHLLVSDGDTIERGDIIANTPKSVSIASDITGGLPRVIELFEAQYPASRTILSEIDGYVRLGELSNGIQQLYVESQCGITCKYSIPSSIDLLVRDGDFVRCGYQLTDGVVSCHNILQVKGVTETCKFLINELRSVYELQGVEIAQKHIEIIIKRMFDYVEVINSGDTSLFDGQLITKAEFMAENRKFDWKKIVIDPSGSTTYKNGDIVSYYELMQENKKLTSTGMQEMTVRDVKRAIGKVQVYGITHVALKNSSFLSAASFQETSRVLTDAAVAGTKDNMIGLKENVITGGLIPAGTGYPKFRKLRVIKRPDAPATVNHLVA